jgi:hypothetical protein
MVVDLFCLAFLDAVTLSLHCCYILLTLLLHYCYTVVTLLLYPSYTAVTLLTCPVLLSWMAVTRGLKLIAMGPLLSSGTSSGAMRDALTSSKAP